MSRSYLLGVEMPGNFSFLCIHLKHIIRVLRNTLRVRWIRMYYDWHLNSTYSQFSNWHNPSTGQGHNNQERKIIKVNTRRIKVKMWPHHSGKFTVQIFQIGQDRQRLARTSKEQLLMIQEDTRPQLIMTCWNHSGNFYKWVSSHSEHFYSSCEGF